MSQNNKDQAGWRKIPLAIYCNSEEEYQQMIGISKEISQLLQVKATQVLSAVPKMRANESDLRSLFSKIQANGIGALLSLDTGRIIRRLMKTM